MALSFPVGPVGTLPRTYPVTTLSDGEPPPVGSLREAITLANLNPGADIVDLTGLSGTIVLTSGQIQISGPLRINGPGADVLAIDGNANSRIFSIYATDPACPGLDGPDYLVAISGLRLTNARRNVAGSNGGAIFTEHSLSLDGVLIDNNIARGGAGVAMYVQYPGQVLTITDSQFNSNTATELLTATDTFPVAGGALYVVQRCANAQDVPYTQPVTVNIANSEFRGNLVEPLTTHDGRGGAIRSYSLADITIIDTIVSNNSVVAPTPLVAGYVHRGGGLEITAKSLFVDGSEISDNSVLESLGGDSTRGGGLMLANSSYDRQGPSGAMGARIVNSTISGNAATASVGAILVVGNVALELDNATVAGNVAAATRTGGIARRAFSFVSRPATSSRNRGFIRSPFVAS